MCYHLVVIATQGSKCLGAKIQPSCVSLGLFNESCVWDLEAGSLCSLKLNGV